MSKKDEARRDGSAWIKALLTPTLEFPERGGKAAPAVDERDAEVTSGAELVSEAVGATRSKLEPVISLALERRVVKKELSALAFPDLGGGALVLKLVLLGGTRKEEKSSSLSNGKRTAFSSSILLVGSLSM